MGKEDCLFCKIANEQIPGKIVYNRNGIVGFEDLYPAAPTHILFIPRLHLTSMAELSAEHGELLSNLFRAANEVAHERGLDDLEHEGYRFVTNIGSNAGQSIHHLHFHLLGGRKFTWPPG